VVSGGMLVSMGAGAAEVVHGLVAVSLPAAVVRQNPIRSLAAPHGNDLLAGQPTATRAARIVAIAISVYQSGVRVNGAHWAL
jgi:hypothetical protein